ncbi:glycosyltransferase family 2 protein [Leucobacter tenebrionis]|uniref:glycosyltransferase family 2 protein n=1 Tax=Leucobacter tenebrionis TaxID=2873270 RepID=UPI001CA63893|nr:glycosyltransferase family 2 protein [Leucobacter tenebrionis]QZY51891.1 glycosyltransferase [Leucobacter tenebrionis]
MTVSAPLVSVVIPVYNSMPYLTATLESVLAQDVESLEVIAVDDGSTDGSGEELDRFDELDERLTVIHQENSGWPGAPRNRGLERARGEFVFFMDSDDTIAPHALRTMATMAEERGADVVIPRMQGVAGRGVQSLFQRYPQGDIGLSRAMETLSPQKLFRREPLERDGLRFPEEHVRLEDGIFVTRAYVLARKILFCGQDPLYFIALRDDGQNISARSIDPENYVSSCRRIAQTLLEGVPDPERAARLVWQFFTRKGLRFYAPRRWLAMDADRKREWVSLHRAFLRDLVPPELDRRAPNPTDRRKAALIRSGDVEGLDRLISAAAGLDHHSRATAVVRVPEGIELTITLAGAEPGADAAAGAVEGMGNGTGADGSGSGSLIRSGRASDLRLRVADRLHRALRPVLGSHLGRGLSRRLTDAVSIGAPRVHLLLSGRRSARRVAVPGRAGRPDASGALRYRFILPDELLRRFRGDRVDMWTVAEVRGLSGGAVRVGADKVSKRGAGDGRSSVNVELYATDQGNASLRFAR